MVVRQFLESDFILREKSSICTISIISPVLQLQINMPEKSSLVPNGLNEIVDMPVNFFCDKKGPDRDPAR